MDLRQTGQNQTKLGFRDFLKFGLLVFLNIA